MNDKTQHSVEHSDASTDTGNQAVFDEANPAQAMGVATNNTPATVEQDSSTEKTIYYKFVNRSVKGDDMLHAMAASKYKTDKKMLYAELAKQTQLGDF